MSPSVKISYYQAVTNALNDVRGDAIKTAAIKHAERLTLSVFDISYIACSPSILSDLVTNSRNKEEALLYIKLYSLVVRFEEKQKQFEMNGNQKAYEACHRLTTTLVENIETHFKQENLLDNRENHIHAFHEACMQVLDDVKDELESHRGVHRILDAMATILASLIIFYPLTYFYQKMNRINYTFFKTDSRDGLDELENVMNEINGKN